MSDRPDADDRALVVRAPAKINLTLDVLGRRPDGYHELRSVMQTLDLHDRLELRHAPALHFQCTVPDLSGDDNLVVRAARLLQQVTGYRGGAAMRLHKRIPVDAGLGGGSSDAAAALIGLNRLWNLGLSRSQLIDLAAKLGSDVPFFVFAPTALVAGRGERVHSLPPPPPIFAVLHKPASGVSTARVFGAFPSDRYGDGTATALMVRALREEWSPAKWPLSNGLQDTVAALSPEVAAALAHLREAGAPTPRLTGSGSTVYALFTGAEDACAVYDRLRTAGRFALLARTVTTPVRIEVTGKP